MIDVRSLKFHRRLCDFTVAACCFGIIGSPVAAFAAGKQPKFAPKDVGGHRVVYVTPLFEDGEPELNVAVEAETYNSKGIATERMTCMTQMRGDSFDPRLLSHVGANINAEKGQVNYSADYSNGVRANVLLFRDKGAKSAKLVTNNARLADTMHHFPDEKYSIGTPSSEGAISKGLYNACVAIVGEANVLESNPKANRVSVRPNGPLTTRAYHRPMTEQSPSARDVFLSSGSQYGHFLKELGLK